MALTAGMRWSDKKLEWMRAAALREGENTDERIAARDALFAAALQAHKALVARGDIANLKTAKGVLLGAALRYADSVATEPQ